MDCYMDCYMEIPIVICKNSTPVLDERSRASYVDILELRAPGAGCYSHFCSRRATCQPRAAHGELRDSPAQLADSPTVLCRVLHEFYGALQGPYRDLNELYGTPYSSQRASYSLLSTESSVQLTDPRLKLCSIETNYIQLKRRPSRDKKNATFLSTVTPLPPRVQRWGDRLSFSRASQH